MNPFIYYYRTNWFRSALKQFLKDPFGKSHFKGKPKYRKREKKTDAEKNDGQENQRENETRLSEEHHSERRKGLTIVSIQALQSHLCDHEQNGNTRIENQLQKRNNFAFISAGGVENSALRREVQRKEEDKDVSNELTLRRRSDGDIISKRKGFFTKGQFHPLSKSCDNVFCYKKEQKDKGNDMNRQKRDKIKNEKILFSKTRVRPLSKSCENVKYFS